MLRRFTQHSASLSEKTGTHQTSTVVVSLVALHSMHQSSCHDATTVSAGHLLNAAYTASYAAPQLIRYYGRLVKAMLDNPNDIWAAATVIYQVVTSASDTREAPGDCMFGPTMQQIDQLMKLASKKEQNRFLRKAIQKEQALWVSAFTGHWPHCC